MTESQNQIQAIMDCTLILHGFTRKVSSWYRNTNGLIHVVNLQKSSYGDQYYINLCCVPPGISVEGMPIPKEHKCPIRIRLTSAFPESQNHISQVLDIADHTLDCGERQQLLSAIINDLVIPFFDAISNNDLLREAIYRGVFRRGLVSKSVYAMFGN